MIDAPDYYDPHDILCGEQRVKVRFNQTVPWSPLLYCDEPPGSMVCLSACNCS